MKAEEQGGTGRTAAIDAARICTFLHRVTRQELAQPFHKRYPLYQRKLSKIFQDLGVHELPEPLTIKIDGDLANKHVMPMYEGGETLSGIGLLFTRVAHYLLIGNVRQRAPYDSRLKILTRSPKEGSIEFDFVGFLTEAAPTSVIGQITLSVTANLVFGVGVYIFQKLTGRSANLPQDIRRLERERPGDIDALTEANLPSAKKAHSLINNGASLISIRGNHNTVILNSDSKEYINTTIEVDDLIWVEASIGWLNSNSRSGGAYVYELGRIVPFDIAKNTSPKSLIVLSESHSEYFLGNKGASRISIRVSQFNSIDGRVKRYRLFEATKPSD